MKLISVLGLSAFFTFSGVGSAQNFNFYQEANSVVSAIDQKLLACNLRILDPFTPGLPYPQVYADKAIVSPNGQLLAYFAYEHGGGGDTLVYKNPNGGMRHQVEFNISDLYYVTPLAGTVAHGNRFRTVNGFNYNFYCRSAPVFSLNDFRNCVTYNFVNLVTDQLCRFGAL